MRGEDVWYLATSASTPGSAAAIEYWYFSTMRAAAVGPADARLIEFHRSKYGRELLIDVGWVSELDGFIATAQPHRLAFFDVLLVTNGRGWFEIDDRRVAVAPRTLLFSAPGQVRRLRIDALEGLALFFPADFLQTFFVDRLFLQRLSFFGQEPCGRAFRLGAREARGLRARLLTMRDEIRDPQLDSVHLLRAQLYESLVWLNRAYARAWGVTTGMQSSSVITQLRQLIDDSVGTRRGVSWFARELALSPGHLRALTRRHLGVSVVRLMDEHAVVATKRELLYSEASCAQVASRMGFADAAYFSRWFRRLTGESPREFRRRSRLDA